MLKYKSIFFTIIIAISSNSLLFAQGEANKEDNKLTSSIKDNTASEIFCDDRINKLMKTKLSWNESNPTIEGYRVQIYFASGNNSRKMVNDIRTKFLIKYPNVGAYEIWQSPNFKVRVGDYRTKLEAYKFYKEIKFDFPSSFIVKDNISLPKLD